MVHNTDARHRIGFVLIPQFSMIAFASAVETLRLANSVIGKPAYSWRTLSGRDRSVAASNGLEVTVDEKLRDTDPLDTIFVCGGVDIQDHEDKSIIAGLRKHAAHGVTLGALCTGTHLLARAGLLNGYRCTIHWVRIPAFVEAFPDVEVVPDLFAVDRNRYTCAGGTAVLDLMLSLISDQYGLAVASAVSDGLIHHRIREPHEGQRMDLQLRSGVSHPKLLSVIETMENNLEQPANCNELASSVNLSIRQMERLFHHHLGLPPTRYYLRMRIERARFLLRETPLPIFDIALATGFASASHFSKCFRAQFGVSPSSERRSKKAFESSSATTTRQLPKNSSPNLAAPTG